MASAKKVAPYPGEWEWTPYIAGCLPDRHWLCRFRDEVTGREWTGRASEFPWEFNVAYLWWKKTGLEKEKGNVSR